VVLQYRQLVKRVFSVSAILVHVTLQKEIVLKWHALSQRFDDKSIGEWRRRLQCVVDQNGGQTNVSNQPLRVNSWFRGLWL